MMKTSKIAKWLAKLTPEKRKLALEDLIYHLVEEKNAQKVKRFLTDFYFLEAKITHYSVQPLIEDYEQVSKSEIPISKNKKCDLKLIQKTLQQSADILSQDQHQLPSLILGKLLPLNNPAFKDLLKQAKKCELYPWLQPLTVGLSSPVQSIINTITTKYQGDVKAVAISADGKWAVSSEQRDSDERSRKEADIFKVWNLSNGSIEQIFKIQKVREFDPYDHENSPKKKKIYANISALALSCNGRWAAAGGIAIAKKGIDQAVVELWDLKTGQSLIQFIAIYKQNISALAISENGQQIVTGFEDGRLRVWMLNEQKSKILSEGFLNDPLFSSSMTINAVALSPDGHWVVAADDIFLSFWDVAKGKPVQCFRMFSKVSGGTSIVRSNREVGSLKAIALDSKGQATALFEDGTLKVWNFKIPQNSQNLSFAHGIKKLNQRGWEPLFYFRGLIENFTPGLEIVASRLFMLLFNKVSYSKSVRKLISGVIFKSYKLLSKNFNFYSDEKAILLQLALLWKSIQAFSQVQAETFHIQGLDRYAPVSITPTMLDDNDDQLKLAVSTNKIGTLQIFDLHDAQPVLSSPGKYQKKQFSSEKILSSELQEPWGQAIAISLDGNWVFSSPGLKVLEMWDITRREKTDSLQRKRNSSCSHINLVAKSLNGRWVFLISGSTFDVWDLAEDSERDLRSRWLLKDVSSNGSWGLWQSGTRTLRLTNLKTGKIISELRDYYGKLEEGSQAWKYTKDKNWRSTNWKYKTLTHDANRSSISANGDSVLIYSYRAAQTILWQHNHCLILWDIASNSIHNTLSAYQKLLSTQENTWIRTNTSVMFTSDGKQVLFGLENGELKFCDLITDRIIYTLKGHRESITSIAISQDDHWAVSSSSDQTLKIWNLQSGKLIATYTAESALYSCRITLTLKGRIFATASDEAKKVHVFQLRLPIDYYSTFQKNDSLEPLENNAEQLTPQSDWSPINLQVDHGIPLPLDQLKDLSVSLNSEVGIDYTKLQELLMKGRWEEADKETQHIMRETINREVKKFNSNDARYFPETDLLTIDRLWLKYSHGLYGFSLQMRIFSEFLDYSLFLRMLGRGALDNIRPCENVHLRKGHFPCLIHLWQKEIAVPLLIRLAECSGYAHLGEYQDRYYYQYYETIPSTTSEIPEEALRLFSHIIASSTSDRIENIEEEKAIPPPTVVTYQFDLKGIPGQSAYIKTEIQGTGFLELTLHEQQRLIHQRCLVYEENKQYTSKFIMPLPLIPWESDLVGHLIFKSLKKDSLCKIDFTVICPIETSQELKYFNHLYTSSSLYRLLEKQKRLLGEYHPDVEHTLDLLVKTCQQHNRYAEAESFRIQKQKIQDQRIKVPLECEQFKITLLLSPDEIIP